MKNKIIVALFIAISLSSCVSEDANYKIITEHSSYYAKKYRKEGNCIYFNVSSNGRTTQPTTIDNAENDI
jgi:hypothetical protein